jgi:hypothetical protein
MQDFVGCVRHRNTIMIVTVESVLLVIIVLTQLTNAYLDNNTVVSLSRVLLGDWDNTYINDILSTYTFHGNLENKNKFTLGSMFTPIRLMLPPRTWPTLCSNGIPNATRTEIEHFNNNNNPVSFEIISLFLNLSENSNDRCSITEMLQN